MLMASCVGTGGNKRKRARAALNVGEGKSYWAERRQHCKERGGVVGLPIRWAAEEREKQVNVLPDIRERCFLT